MAFHLADDRYDRLRLISWWNQERLAAARVLVVGAGALGNEVLKNLALLGVGTIYVADFEAVETSNLARSVLFRPKHCGTPKALVAAEAVREMNPDVDAVPLVGNVMLSLGLGLMAEVDVVIGCLDNREARLWVNRACWKVGTPWIDGGLHELSGVAKVFVPPDSACYECAMTENDYRLVNQRYSCPQLPRDDVATAHVPTTPTIAAVIGGLQVQEAVKLLHGLPVEAGAAHVFNGDANRFYTTKFQHRDDCLSHETYPAPQELDLSTLDRAADLFAALRAAVDSSEPLRLHLDRDLVVSCHCTPCDNSWGLLRPALALLASQATCPRCGEVAAPRMVHVVEENSPLAEEKLSSLGVPPFDIVRASAGEHEWHVLLAGDRARVLHEGLTEVGSVARAVHESTSQPDA